MDRAELAERAHDLDVTLWVGKAGLDSVVDELTAQLDDHDVVKAKFLEAARAGESTEAVAVELADRAGCAVFETRGHTAVFVDE